MKVVKEEIEQYPLKLRKSLMTKARDKSKEEDISLNQWFRNAVKSKLKIK